jgi:predicted ATP-dependent serine protease
MSDPDEILTVMQQDMCAPMVGRARELARLVDLLDSVAGGEAAVALVSGDAGVGKTRLVTRRCATERDR